MKGVNANSKMNTKFAVPELPHFLQNALNFQVLLLIGRRGESCFLELSEAYGGWLGLYKTVGSVGLKLVAIAEDFRFLGTKFWACSNFQWGF